MPKSPNNPLDLLNLKGQDKLQEKIAVEEGVSLEALIIEEPAVLGNLKDLPGTWVGPGFNLIELPNMNQAKPGPPPPDKFKLMLNATSETLVFSDIEGEVVNRGNAQGDIKYLGLHYLQQVIDVNLPQGQNGIHLETGLFLNLPDGTDPSVQPSIARLGSIPHGDSLLAQGSSFVVPGGPQFNIPVGADPTPFTIVNGKRQNNTSAEYMSIFQNAVPPPGIPKEAIMQPNILLENAIKGQNIIETTVILLDANPVDGVSNVAPSSTPVGGITNIPFINVNANATTLTAIFWIETVQEPNGNTFKQLQYTQTVILDFPVFGHDGTVEQIKWPHIVVATLRKQP
jgi:hypothetical protein